MYCQFQLSIVVTESQSESETQNTVTADRLYVRNCLCRSH